MAKKTSKRKAQAPAAGSFILVLNAGSSSLKYALYEAQDLTEVLKGHVDGIGLDRCELKVKKGSEEFQEAFKAQDHLHAALKAVHSLQTHGIITDLSAITHVGHRVVHGGETFVEPTLITPAVLSRIKDLSVLAPLHNPPAVAGILATQSLLPKASHYAVFDTAFHHTIPKEAFLYGIPYQLYEEMGIRKYGFHGISHEYVASLARKALRVDAAPHAMVTCHLGNGSSITAIKDGQSVDTSMGFTPLDGLIMGTRSGELDPEIILYLLERKHYTPERLKTILNKESGLKGIAGASDVRELHARADHGDEQAILALDMLAYRIAKFVGAYAAALNGLDAIVFTGGIGQNAHYVRRKTCDYLTHLGLILDEKANKENHVFITTPASKVAVLVLPTDEERAIAEKITNP